MTIFRLIVFIIGMNIAILVDQPVVQGLGIGLAACAIFL